MWLLPVRMVINTASKIGYNNDLRRASPQTRLGVNDNVNVDIKQINDVMKDLRG